MVTRANEVDTLFDDYLASLAKHEAKKAEVLYEHLRTAMHIVNAATGANSDVLVAHVFDALKPTSRRTAKPDATPELPAKEVELTERQKRIQGYVQGD